MDASPVMIRLARERVPTASFTVGDLGERLPYDDGSFDVAVASLVMHYLRDWVPTLREVRRVLSPEGVFVLSTHQPTMDAELADSDDYFATELLRDRWTVAWREYDVRFWHRPLSGMFRAFKEAGFVVDELSEPQPLPECRERFPEAWERLTTKPHFLFLRLVARH